MSLTTTEIGNVCLVCDAQRCSEALVSAVSQADVLTTARAGRWFVGTLHFCDRHAYLGALANPTQTNTQLAASYAAAIAAPDPTTAATLKAELVARGAADQAVAATSGIAPSVLTVDGQILTRAAGVPAPITRASLAADTAFTGAFVASSGPRPYYLNAYTNFFAGPFVTAQGTTGTTLTAQATAAATTMSVTSGASFPNGTVIITNQGTATQQQYVVTSGGSTTTLTISPAIVTTIANGATINPLWTNSFHMTSAGYTAFYYWLFHFQVSGVNVIQAPAALKRVTFLGNSWGTLGSTEYAAQVAAALPGSLSTNTSVSGNTSALMLARFDTDVPADSAYVIINEPAANDVNLQADFASMSATVASLVAKCQAIGAVAVFTGMIQSWDRPGLALRQNTVLLGMFSAPTMFPSTSASGMLNIIEPATSNLGLGRSAGQNVTTGTNNTALGDSALKAATTTVGLTAIGSNALLVASTATQDTAVGSSALGALTTATQNTAVGYEAGYRPNNVVANACVSANANTFIGFQTGYPSTTQSTNAVAIGALATAGAGNFATALGSKTSAAAAGSVAIGCDNGGTGASTAVANEIKIGTALHTVNIIGGALVAAAGTNLGFYGTTPIAKQTGVAVTAAGIHAAIVALGLFAA